MKGIYLVLEIKIKISVIGSLQPCLSVRLAREHMKSMRIAGNEEEQEAGNIANLKIYINHNEISISRKILNVRILESTQNKTPKIYCERHYLSQSLRIVSNWIRGSSKIKREYPVGKNLPTYDHGRETIGIMLSCSYSTNESETTS
jgi:hypothetical protein